MVVMVQTQSSKEAVTVASVVIRKKLGAVGAVVKGKRHSYKITGSRRSCPHTHTRPTPIGPQASSHLALGKGLRSWTPGLFYLQGLFERCFPSGSSGSLFVMQFGTRSPLDLSWGAQALDFDLRASGGKARQGKQILQV